MEFNDPLIAVFVFAIGCCVGSFLNVVVWRLPRGESLVTPPSACPKCGHKLSPRDNIPVLGWLILRGRCRYCKNPISPKYPVVELLVGLLFAGHYWLLFRGGWGPYEVTLVQTLYGTLTPVTRVPLLDRDWPVLVLHLWLIGALLAATLIDWEHFIIPAEITRYTMIVGLVIHTLGRPAGSLGHLHFSPAWQAAALGGGVGLLVSLALLRAGLMKRSFEDDAPMLEHEREAKAKSDAEAGDAPPEVDPWTPARIRKEMRLEMLFVLVPILLAAAAMAAVAYLPAVASAWQPVVTQRQIGGFLGAILGGLVGGGVIWLVRILGSYGFGREAMGLGDVHLMFAVGCCLGPGPATAAFFLAPAAALCIALPAFVFNGRRELPFGPYLSLATYATMLFYTPIKAYLEPGVTGLIWAFQSATTGGTP